MSLRRDKRERQAKNKKGKFEKQRYDVIHKCTDLNTCVCACAHNFPLGLGDNSKFPLC